MRFASLVIGISALASLTACAPTTHYAWGGYENALYRHYKSPQDRSAFVEELNTIILSAKQAGEKVPPGIYAEYGYALFEEGRIPEAKSFFQMEHETWPESRVLMDKMIRNVEQREGRPPSVQPSAEALEIKDNS